MSDILALDLGSTRIKLGALDANGGLRIAGRRKAPLLLEQGDRRTSDPYAYLQAADELLARQRPARGTALGLTTQRSSFLLWERHSGRPVTPLISWQDLRADAWCRAHAERRAGWLRETGLRLSPHYAAPKLAMLLEEDPDLRDRAQRGLILFGTLDTWLLWQWTDGGHFETDVSVAARTMLVALATGDWGPALLAAFGVPRAMLPRIRSSNGFHLQTNRRVGVAATVADQAAGAIPLFYSEPDCVYLNAGTGTFAMRAASGLAPPGYQTALLDGALPGPGSLWEGAVNGGAQLMQDFTLPADLATMLLLLPDGAFAIPDHSGLGAPYWRADLSLHLSRAALDLDGEGRRLLLFQCFLFRIRQIIEGLFPDDPPRKVVLSGGLTARRGFAALLRAFLRLPLFVLAERDMGLWGAAWLAGGCSFRPQFKLRPANPSPLADGMEQRYRQWLLWMEKTTAQSSDGGG